MKKFLVTVRTQTDRFTYCAIARNSWELVDHALELFSVCGVTVRPL